MDPKAISEVSRHMTEGAARRGIQSLEKTLLDYDNLYSDRLTVTGRTLAENVKHVAWNDHQDVVCTASRSIPVISGVVGFNDNLAPEDAIVKVAGVSVLQFGAQKYAQTVGSARDGAVTHPGGAKETHCYADI